MLRRQRRRWWRQQEWRRKPQEEEGDQWWKVATAPVGCQQVALAAIQSVDEMVGRRHARASRSTKQQHMYNREGKYVPLAEAVGWRGWIPPVSCDMCCCTRDFPRARWQWRGTACTHGTRSSDNTYSGYTQARYASPSPLPLRVRLQLTQGPQRQEICP